MTPEAAAFTIREATAADAHQIAEVHLAGWRWGYRDLLPDHAIEARSVEDRERLWTEILTEPRVDGGACFVADDPAGVIGFVAAGPADDDFAVHPAGAGEVHALYLQERVRGTGVGRALFGQANEAMRSYGFPTAVLWVFEANALARRFYEAAGWAPDGALGVHRLEGEDGERLVMRYSVDLWSVGTLR